MACVEACSLTHESKCSYRRSRIIIEKDEVNAVFVPLLCEMCEAHCMYVCPHNAIHFDTELAMPMIDEGKCTGCLKCVKECPFQGINWDSKNKKALKCDLCGGDPVCVKVCDTKALVAIEPQRDLLLKKYENACSKLRVYKEAIEPAKKVFKKTSKTAEVS
jgi:anaerobic carbon-monoxide dehydrogenase iron sulfur subunit